MIPCRKKLARIDLQVPSRHDVCEELNFSCRLPVACRQSLGRFRSGCISGSAGLQARVEPPAQFPSFSPWGNSHFASTPKSLSVALPLLQTVKTIQDTRHGYLQNSLYSSGPASQPWLWKWPVTSIHNFRDDRGLLKKALGNAIQLDQFVVLSIVLLGKSDQKDDRSHLAPVWEAVTRWILGRQNQLAHPRTALHESRTPLKIARFCFRPQKELLFPKAACTRGHTPRKDAC